MNIKTGPVGSLTIEELILADAFLGLMVDRIHEGGYDVPSSTLDEQRQVCRELSERLRADKERQLQIVNSRLQTLKTLPERRAEAEALKEQLEIELGYKTSTKTSKAARGGGK